jgi:membrane protease YdiL (CAAX protease family)
MLDPLSLAAAPVAPAPPVAERIEALPLPLETFQDVSWFHSFIGHPNVKALLPIPIIAALVPALWWMFRDTWRELDREALEFRLQLRDRDEVDYRPLVCLVVVAVVLTLQEYYGGRAYYDTVLRPLLQDLYGSGWTFLRLPKYDSLYSYGWWVFARVLGYVIVPLVVWKACFRQDSLLDLGLRGRGFLKHLWIYGVFLAIIIPVMLIVARQPDFGTYYPFYKLSSRSWFDFMAWEAIYFVQFFALEFFFRSTGAAAIFIMCLPYCMIHYGKPYLEAHGAIIAGVVLGSLSMKTKSVYSGFLLHISVAFGMDLLSLYKRGQLPSVFWAPN